MISTDDADKNYIVLYRMVYGCIGEAGELCDMCDWIEVQRSRS